MRLLDGGFSQSRKRGRKKRERDLTRQEYLDSIATSTAFIPGLGDIAEFGSLANREYEGVDKPAWWEYALATVPGGLGAAAGLIPKRMGKLADDPMPEKITAYHGSPHDFDKFSMSQIGTGEGAQAYGHGLYFADSEDVARGYRDALTDNQYIAPQHIDEISDTLEKAGIEGADEVGMYLLETDYSPSTSSLEDILEPEEYALLSEGDIKKINGVFEKIESPGYLYQVEIDASPDEFLEWDLPLSEQAETVKNLMRSLDSDFGNLPEFGTPLTPRQKMSIEARHMMQGSDYTGRDLYLKMADSYTDADALEERIRKLTADYLDTGDMDKKMRLAAEIDTLGDELSSIRQGNYNAASLAFDREGIKGIRYKDGFSRGTDGGTSNYVVFDENIISIAKKYGLAIPAAAALYGNMTGQDASSLYSEEAVGRLGEANET